MLIGIFGMFRTIRGRTERGSEVAFHMMYLLKSSSVSNNLDIVGFASKIDSSFVITTEDHMEILTMTCSDNKQIY